MKARNFVDAYLISKEKGVNLRGLEKETIGKIQLMLDLYERFRNNFSEKRELLESGEFFSWGKEKELLLTEIDEENFYAYISIEFTQVFRGKIPRFINCQTYLLRTTFLTLRSRFCKLQKICKTGRIKSVSCFVHYQRKFKKES